MLSSTAPSGPAPMSPAWAAYLFILSVSMLVQVTCVVGLVYITIGGLRRWASRKKISDGVAGPVAVIVPCYLPNEASIIERTLRHVLEQLVGVDGLDLHLVYNTPKAMPAMEAKLLELAAEPQASGRRLFVHHVAGSSSKAQNLNYIIPSLDAAQTPYTAIYDADHHPDPRSLGMAIAHLKAVGVDCVQGSTYIREGFLPLRMLICAEFFMTYFVMLPVMQALTGTGFFGGSNAVWKTTSLQVMKFDEHALTEDIDCFARAVLDHGLTFTFLPECCSGELLPSGFRAFWKQRLRWAMGWDQTTTRHAPSFAKLPFYKRAALYYIFVFRWFSQLCATVCILTNLSAGLQAFLFGTLSVAKDTPPIVKQLQFASFCLFCVMGLYAFARAALHDFRTVIGLWVYFTFMPGYVLFGSTLLLCSMSRIASGNLGEWVVTSRATSALAAPLLDGGALDSPQPARKPKTWIDVIMAAGFMAQGSVFGVFVGYTVGMKEVAQPLWGWLPTWLGAAHVYVLDDRALVLGFVLGAAFGAIAYLGAGFVHKQSGSQEPSELHRGHPPLPFSGVLA